MIDSLLLCAAPGVKVQVDEVYGEEARAARERALKVLLLDHDAAAGGQMDRALRHVPAGTGRLMYRGWMLPAERYAELTQALRAKGYMPITSAEDYSACHHLPGWYDSISDLTPRSRWLGHGPPYRVEEFRDLLDGWAGPVVVKDYVKSEKHAWHEACFVPDPTNFDAAIRVINRFIELRGRDFEGGLVLRAFADLRRTGTHPRSGMPLAEEIRTFWAGSRLIAAGDYWTDGPAAEIPDVVREAARRVSRPFFTVDAARLSSGSWIIMEVGDGQVSALPDGVSTDAFWTGMLGSDAKPA
ncbi:MAG: ATP-grasp domain-containing protein [Tepidisphaera sp.]